MANEPRALILRFTLTSDAEDQKGSAYRDESSTAAILRMSREGDDVATSDERDFARWVEQTKLHPHDPVIIDLTGSTFANSARISVMVKLRQTIGPARRMSIVAPDPMMANVLKRCHIDRLIPIHATLDEARAAPL